MKAWLAKWIARLVAIFVHEAVEQVKTEINTPDTMTNESTPKPVANRFAGNFRQWLRKKQDDNPQQ